MDYSHYNRTPTGCPACGAELVITRLQCSRCGTEVTGVFPLSRLAALREPHASIIELFLRVRGNVKEMERELGWSYPTVRARLEEALAAAGMERDSPGNSGEMELANQRKAILEELDRGEISAAEATVRLRELKS